MARSKKSNGNSSNDILHIVTIIFLLIIICVIIYLIYNTLKSKGEFFEVIKTIENYEMKLTKDATLTQYKDDEKKFQTDLTTNSASYESSLNTANPEFSKYKASYDTLDITDLQSQLKKVNDTVSQINGRIDKITNSNEVQPIITSLQTLAESLGPIKDKAKIKKDTVEKLKKDNEKVSKLLKTASDNASLVIRDIEQGNLLREAFDTNYSPKVQKQIEYARNALSNIPTSGKDDTENQILKTSRDRLDKTIKDLDDVLKIASTKLDKSKYIAQKNKIEEAKTKLDGDKGTIDGYLILFDGMITNIDIVDSTCSSYTDNLPKIKTALENMKDVIVNYEELLKFNSEIDAL